MREVGCTDGVDGTGASLTESVGADGVESART